MNLAYPLVAARVALSSYNEVSSHRHHPDAKPLDEAIQTIAKEKLGMKSFDGIQVVDDFQCGELSKSWSLYPFAKPVIAIQKGLEEIAPQARKYLILTELHKCNSSLRLVELTSKVALSFLVISFLSTGGGMAVVGGKIITLAMTSSIVDSLVRGHFTKRAHDFAIKEFDEQGQRQIRMAYAAMQDFRKENRLPRVRVLDEVSSLDLEELKLEIEGFRMDYIKKTIVFTNQEKLLKQCLEKIFKISTSKLSDEKKSILNRRLIEFIEGLENENSEKVLYNICNNYPFELQKLIQARKELLKPIKEKFSLAATGLDLPFKLRPAMDKSEFYQARESYHLKDFEEKKQYLDFATAFVVMGAFAALREALPQVNFILAGMAASTVAEPIIKHLNYLYYDWEFASSTKVTRPETIDPSVWKGWL